MPSEPLPDGSVVVSIPISRRDWADITNTTVETICRTLGQLAEPGVVESLAPGRYRIADLAELSRLAGIDPDLDRIANCRGTSEGQAVPHAQPNRTRPRDPVLPPIAGRSLADGSRLGSALGALRH